MYRSSRQATACAASDPAALVFATEPDASRTRPARTYTVERGARLDPRTSRRRYAPSGRHRILRARARRSAGAEPSAKPPRRRRIPTITVMIAERLPRRRPRPGDRTPTRLRDAIDAAGEILNQVDAHQLPGAREAAGAGDQAVRSPISSACRRSRSGASQTPSDYTATPATEVRYDFLETLRQELGPPAAPYRSSSSRTSSTRSCPPTPTAATRPGRRASSAPTSTVA